ncbi:MAG: hypothetical protein ABIM54_00830 [candidate division WOR-3 bacterium]
MSYDYLPFQRPGWDIKDFASLQELLVNIFIIETSPIQPGETRTYDIITVPTGRKLFISGLVESFEYRTETHVYISGGPTLFKGYKEEFMHFFSAFAPTFLFPAGTTFKLDCKNVDIVPGRFSTIWQGFLLPASEPEKPKDNSLYEKFRVADYHYCTKYYLPDNEVLIVFYKLRDKQRNFLRLKNYGTPSKKIISQMILEPDKAQEIISTLHSEPEKVKEFLEKLEKKFKIE